MHKKITTAVFPVAGMGTRFLPATKANPKEMLPIVDKPLIQYAVEEAIQAGITKLIFVTNSNKRAIEDHFDSNYELELMLSSKGKYDLLATVREILPKGISAAYIRQPNPLGLGHAVLCARPVINNEPFAVLLADDLIDGGRYGCLSQLCDAYQQTARSVIAIEPIPLEESCHYGIVAVEQTNQVLSSLRGIIEKPAMQDAPSNLAVIGRYILNPGIFDCLDDLSAGAGGEIQLTDAIARLLIKEEVYALQFIGKRYDCGSKLGFLQASIAFALKHHEIGKDFSNYLRQLSKSVAKEEKLFADA
ncbi:MAG: UTP--glucose-1-phosphate uridylyltransferase GalU [Legionellales bacterium]|nr:UTP--glucose-1-phosphate uridylyltransferase GalU [Legionellales bacterium]